MKASVKMKDTTGSAVSSGSGNPTARNAVTTKVDTMDKYEEALQKAKAAYGSGAYDDTTMEFIFPELRESEDERIRRTLVEYFGPEVQLDLVRGVPIQKIRDWLEKQKENPKSADSIPADCVSDAKCENRWHKVQDSLPDNGRLVLAQDCLGNTLLARYDGEGNWEVSVYDNEDYYCRNAITKWCEIPSEKQKEQKPAEIDVKALLTADRLASAEMTGRLKERSEILENPEKYGLCKPAEWSEILGIKAHNLYQRKYRGWDDERILNTPVKTKK